MATKALVSIKHTFRRDGIYYFSRAVPTDLKAHYTQSRLVRSLRTRSAIKARQAAQMMTSRLDEYWLDLRLRNTSPLFAEKISTEGKLPSSIAPTISEAKELYIQVKGTNKSRAFSLSANRIVRYLISCHGNKPVTDYKSTDAAQFRDWLAKRRLSKSSIHRAFSVIKAIVNLAISELGLECRNVFSGIYLPEVDDAKKRLSVKGGTLKKIQAECMRQDDELRWLLGIISDTGMRLAEAAGLTIDDLVLDSAVPHVIVRKHQHRPLKTESSERLIPLVGVSLWAAERVKRNTKGMFCFPRYNTKSITNSNSASAALNKWLKSLTQDDAVIHGLRHGMRDRLRAVETPLEMIDQIGGWSGKTVGQGYGDGYELSQCQKWMLKAVE